jgi:UDP-glucose 4-epimerase/GDP-4-dehydro-6-deoxy-D-mannose reductase
MTTLYSTGLSGTIGKHLPSDVRALNINLASNKSYFNELELEENSNILHLAGIVGPTEVTRDLQDSQNVNIRGTKLLAKHFLANCEGIFTYVSTSHVYAPSEELISETSPLAPSNVYAEQKLQAEIELQSIFAQYPERLCIIRVFSVLDWDTAPFTLGGGIRKLAEKSSDFVLNNASDVRDFLTPRAVARALHEITTKNRISGVLNLCSGVGTSVGSAARRMLSEGGIEVNENRFSWGNSSNPFVVGDNSRLKSAMPHLDLTWMPSTFN